MFIEILMIGLAVLTLGSSWIVIRGPSAWDRLQGLAVMSSKVVVIIVLLSLFYNETYLADLAIVFSLLGFINLILIARYIRRRQL